MTTLTLYNTYHIKLTSNVSANKTRSPELNKYFV